MKKSKEILDEIENISSHSPFLKNLKIALEETAKNKTDMIVSQECHTFSWNEKRIESILKNKDWDSVYSFDKNYKTPLDFLVENDMKEEFSQLLRNASYKFSDKNSNFLFEAVELAITYEEFCFLDEIFKSDKIDYSVLGQDDSEFSIIDEAVFMDMELADLLIKKGATITNSDLLAIFDNYPDYFDNVNVFDCNNTIEVNKNLDILENKNWFGYILKEISHGNNFSVFSKLLSDIINQPNFDINSQNNYESIYDFFGDIDLRNSNSHKALDFFCSIDGLSWKNTNGDKTTLFHYFLNQQLLYSNIINIDEKVFNRMIEKTGINQQNETGKTLLMTFVEKYSDKSKVLFSYFLNHPKIDLTIEDNDGNNVFHIAENIQSLKNNSVNDDLLETCYDMIIKKKYENKKPKTKKPTM